MIREECGRIKDLGVTEEEIKRAKRSLIHAWTVRMGNHDEIARVLQHMEAQGLGPDYLEKYPRLIEGVSRESLLDCARMRFDFEPSGCRCDEACGCQLIETVVPAPHYPPG